MATPEELEADVLFHRYLYYILAHPQLPDLDYDVLERQARAVCPPDSPVHGLGSSLSSSYPQSVKLRVEKVMGFF